MRRFYFGDEEEDEDEDEMDPKYMFPDPSEFIAMTQFENPDNFLINCSIKICEKSLFWRFYSVSSKINMITDVFNSLKLLTEKEGNKDASI